ncbi:MAG: isoprenylcysteine carboxyl methyltransferase family protein [Vulcanimicrobiaceae bacterium]
MPSPASGLWLLAFVSLQRAVELGIATRKTRRLRAAGAYEIGAGHYPAMVAFHATWLLTLWILGWSRPIVIAFLGVYGLLQLGRLWVLQTLGPRWTTRIIVVPDAAPVATGPYRFLRHPNYAIVAFELPCVSLALGLGWHAIVFGLLNIAMLTWRIRVEDRALAAAHRDHKAIASFTE